MDEELRDAVWKKDKGLCQKCGRKVTETVNLFEDIAERLSVLKEIPIFKWSRECWKCGKETPVVSYDLEVSYNYHLGDIEKLDRALMQKYSFVKRIFSNTMRHEAIANVCIHCGSLQGNSFIGEDLIEMATDGDDLNKSTDCLLPNNLVPEDLLSDKEEQKPFEVKSSVGHVHHKDGKWENNDLGNLVLLCKDCHARLHSEQGKIALNMHSRMHSRKEAKEKARVRREKAQTDNWRAKYYANRQYYVNRKRYAKNSHSNLQRVIKDFETEK